MRRNPLAPSLASLLLVGGCATAPHVVPAEGQAQAVASAAGVTLTVTSQEWEGSPDDLDEYITVVPVELYNAGPSEVRVSYFDFVLLDEAGFRYQAVNPFVPAQASREGAPADRMAGLVYPEEVSPPSVLVAGRGGGGGGRGGGGGGRGGSVRSGGGFGGARVGYGGVRSGGFGRGVRVGGVGWAQPRGVMVRGGLSPRGSIYMGWRAGFGGGWNGYRVFPHYRPWLGAGYGLWWDSPFFWPPGYAAWVLGWGPGWYPASPTVPQDVVNLGLPEGVLEAGGHVAGYLYFQRTHPEAHHLGLSWEIHEAREGTPLGNAQVQLDVVR